MEFRVDIEDSSGNKLGSGPLQSVSRWRYTARMDRAGDIDFVFAASDAQASFVTSRRIARAHALIDDVWTEVGAGVIDAIETAPDNDGVVSLSVGGMDLIRELSYRSVGSLEVGSGSGATHSAALTAISALAPVGWTFTPASSPDNDYIYARYGGESVLGALVYLAQQTQTHFYRSTNRTLVFTSAFSSSGVRAIQATGNLVPETCAIVSLRRTVDTHDLLTRITPYGSGQGEARLTLAATNRAAPTGYVLSAANNYIEHTASTTAYGLVDFPEVEFKEITPIDNTDADLQAAANMLFDAALEELKRRSTLADQETYSLTIAGCSQLLRPMQTIRLVYRDVDQGIDIDEDLYILEATWEIDESGIRTSQLVVSTDDRWPESDASAAAERAVQGRVFTAHPQLNANSYVTAYRGNVDHEETAAFRFRFGTEVVNLQQALFEFQLLPFESTVKSVSSSVVSTSSGGSATPTSSSGGGATSSSGGSHSHTISAHTHNVTLSDHTHSVTIAGHTHDVTIANHTHSVTISDHTHSVPNHQHQITVAGSSGGNALTISEPGSGLGFLTKATAGDVKINTNSDTGSTTSGNGGSTSPTTSSGGGTTVSSTSGGGSSPTTAGGGGTTVASASGGGSTSSSDGSHTHTVAAHTHSVTIAAHDHTVTPDIDTVYGIFRAESDDTYIVNELEYRVNSGSWADLDTADDVDDGWYALDITSLVQDTTTFRPNQTNNLLEIRAKSLGVSITGWTASSELELATSPAHGLTVGEKIIISGASAGSSLGTNINGEYTVSGVDSSTLLSLTPGFSVSDTGNDGVIELNRTATIDAQLSIRNTIQAIAYT